MKTSIELFSGSATVSQVCCQNGYDAWSVDINPKLYPRICCDILKLPLDLLPVQCNFLWASPDCRLFSRNGDSSHWLKIDIGYRRYQYIPVSEESRKALLLVFKTIEIIKAYTGVPFVIENPIGRLRHVPEINYFAPFRYCVNYKDWGFDYSKETDLYTNIYLPFPTKKVQRFGKSVVSVNSRYERSKVPPALVEFILSHIIQ